MLFLGLQNDLRELMKVIEEELHALHSTSGDHENGHGPVSSTDDGCDNSTQPAPHRDSNVPFLKVNEVAAGSPAANSVCKYFVRDS